MPEKKVKITGREKFCPKCGSTDIKSELDNAAKVRLGAPLNLVCSKCGFRNVVFPEREFYQTEEQKKRRRKKG